MTAPTHPKRHTAVPAWLRIFVALLMVYTVYDWYEHVSRPGSEFEARAVAWGAFSAASVGTIVAVMLGVHLVLCRFVPARFAVLTATIGLGVALQVHIFATGPLLEWLLWPGGGLTFKPVAALVLAVIMGLLMAVLAAAEWGAGRLRH